jgi:hypothetical protein
VIVDRATAEAEMGPSECDSSNVFLASQANAFVPTRLFELWVREVRFRAIAKRRAQFGYTGMALLLLDGLGFPYIDEFLDTRAGKAIDVLFLVPHSSDQTQPLGLLTFVLTKGYLSGSRFIQL